MRPWAWLGKKLCLTFALNRVWIPLLTGFQSRARDNSVCLQNISLNLKVCLNRWTIYSMVADALCRKHVFLGLRSQWKSCKLALFCTLVTPYGWCWSKLALSYDTGLVNLCYIRSQTHCPDHHQIWNFHPRNLPVCHSRETNPSLKDPTRIAVLVLMLENLKFCLESFDHS